MLKNAKLFAERLGYAEMPELRTFYSSKELSTFQNFILYLTSCGRSDLTPDLYRDFALVMHEKYGTNPVEVLDNLRTDYSSISKQLMMMKPYFSQLQPIITKKVTRDSRVFILYPIQAEYRSQEKKLFTASPEDLVGKLIDQTVDEAIKILEAREMVEHEMKDENK